MRKASLLGSLGLMACVAGTADGQKIANPALQRVAATERISVSSLTLEQALAKPDGTVLVGRDGKDVSVAQLRKLSLHRQQALGRSKTPRAFLVPASVGKTKSPTGLSRVAEGGHEVAAAVAAANALRTSRLASVGPNRAKIVRPQPGIWEVNGRPKNFVLSPGKPVTLTGLGFGGTMGQANAIGQFPGGALSLRVVDWHDDQVDAMVAPDVTGVPDQPVVVQIVTGAGKVFKLDGGRFYASRQEITLTTGIPRMVRLAAGGPPTTMSDNGDVFRMSSGDSINCFAAGADTLTTVDPGRGFVVTGLSATWGRTDSGDGDYMGDAGSRTFSPGYGFGDWSGDSIRVSWGVWRSHSSPYGMLSGYDECTSEYQIAVTVSGPAGVRPF